jgi:pyruvate, water dikinase
MTVIRPLEDLGAGDLALAGGKGANLGELIRAGFPVPPGFVVTAGAADGDRIPDELGAAIADAYRGLGSPPVAVRSSATAEDLPEASFAGQHETLLDVRGEPAVVEAVAHCLASLRTERAVEYRAQRGFDEESLAIAVVVQRMAAHDVSGVVFTVNPVSGSRDEVLVNAARGSGEAIVGGEVVPDQWVARRPDGAVLSFTPARRAVRTPFMAPARGSLSSDQVRELVALALRVEQHFGGAPQDIEWSYGEGSFSLLQSRPITTLRER